MPFSTWLSNKKGVEIGLPICVHFHVIRCKRALPALPETDALSEEEALRQLEAFLKPRIEEAERGELVNQSVTEIIAELKQERRARNV
jgi:hypothetical protein